MQQNITLSIFSCCQYIINVCLIMSVRNRTKTWHQEDTNFGTTPRGGRSFLGTGSVNSWSAEFEISSPASQKSYTLHSLSFTQVIRSIELSILQFVDGWITLRRISRRWDVGIWTELGWPRWRTLVSAVMNLRVPWNAGNFLTSCKPVSCSGKTLHHGVSK